jgi:SAM-dependent methyltransferase
MRNDSEPDPEEKRTAGAAYSPYYREHGDDRNDLLTNPGVLFQTLAFDRANIRALGKLNLDRSKAKVLDVGCGTGSSILSLLRLGFDPANLSGIDLEQDRIDRALRQAPNVDFRCGDARQLQFADGTFDLVLESTMFVLMPDESLAREIAGEMIRVTRKGRYIMLVDWRYGKPGKAHYRGVSAARIRNLFDVGRRTRVTGVERGALIPPVGRFLSRSLPSLYFTVQALVPPLVGQTTTVLEKIS